MRGVKIWYMTEEERLAYIKKHPIRKTAKPKGAAFSTEFIDHERVNKAKKAKKI